MPRAIVSLDPASVAFGADLLQLAGPLRQRAYRLTRDATQVEDLLQDTMTRAWSARLSFQPGTSLRAWTYTILRNAHLNALRRSSRVVELDARETEDLGAVAAGQHIHVELQEVLRAMDDLPADQRAALSAVALEGLDYESAADRLKVPHAALKSRVHRARAALLLLIEAGRTEAAVRSRPVETGSSSAARARAPVRGLWTVAKLTGRPLWIG
ncbi:sigma-70 family RNA polymerase sigma factor [Sphingomonas arantia]|uniref:Sigma-70 family RNA polymerase sigma factor n=1 Tax=Sphingomonas arantia TaxID=1460676 RepID=A0ABW4TUT9_9SPHN